MLLLAIQTGHVKHSLSEHQFLLLAFQVLQCYGDRLSTFLFTLLGKSSGMAQRVDISP